MSQTTVHLFSTEKKEKKEKSTDESHSVLFCFSLIKFVEKNAVED